MKKKDTSWENSAQWYDEHLEKGSDTYQEKVILPNLTRILELQKSERVLDLACGQGYFTALLAKDAREIVGCDLAKTLIALAQQKKPANAYFHVADAATLSFAKNAEFDAAYCVLALQNMESLAPVFAEVRRVLKPGGRFVFILNHPTFRVLKASSWGFDEKEGVQYRRIDSYLSPAKVAIDMHPGLSSEQTLSFHRSLQDFMKAMRPSGFAITRLEEWISHRKSQKGPRAKAEDHARKEIPLFLAIEARILA